MKSRSHILQWAGFIIPHIITGSPPLTGPL
nr:MAG TPA: hypothetical protein [Caudoviricetes sp.]